MTKNQSSQKMISGALIVIGLLSLIYALVMDFSGSGSSLRGPALIIGVVLFLAGIFTFPTIKYHVKIVNFVFVFPLLFCFVVTVIIPLCLGFFYSTTDWNGIRMTKFLGIQNYTTMFQEPGFLWSVVITVLFGSSGVMVG